MIESFCFFGPESDWFCSLCLSRIITKKTRTFILVVVDDTVGISVKGSVSLASSSLKTDGGTLLSLDKVGTGLS